MVSRKFVQLAVLLMGSPGEGFVRRVPVSPAICRKIGEGIQDSRETSSTQGDIPSDSAGNVLLEVCVARLFVFTCGGS
jgi:hypothetical protein